MKDFVFQFADNISNSVMDTLNKQKAAKMDTMIENYDTCLMSTISEISERDLDQIQSGYSYWCERKDNNKDDFLINKMVMRYAIVMDDMGFETEEW